MSSTTYAAKLKDPRWKRKRRDLIIAAGCACEECGDKESRLQIHHKYHDHSLAPWEYPHKAMCVLCSGCKKARREYERLLLESITAKEGGRILDLAAELSRLKKEQGLSLWDIVLMMQSHRATVSDALKIKPIRSHGRINLN